MAWIMFLIIPSVLVAFFHVKHCSDLSFETARAKNPWFISAGLVAAVLCASETPNVLALLVVVPVAHFETKCDAIQWQRANLIVDDPSNFSDSGPLDSEIDECSRTLQRLSPAVERMIH